MADAEPSQQVSQLSVAPLLPTAGVVSSFSLGSQSPYSTSRYIDPVIACTALPGLAWVKTGDFSIKLLDWHGTVHDAINTNSMFLDIAVTPQGEVIFSDTSNNIIIATKGVTSSWSFTSLFTTEYMPGGICLLHNGNIIVTYLNSPFTKHRVIQYNSKGYIIHAFDPDLFTRPWRIALNKVNGHLYICDEDRKKLLAFDKDHRLLYEYTGLQDSLFYPRDVATDSSGRVLITFNNCVHVLDKDGKFLQYLQPPGLNVPLYIDIDTEGLAWIGELGQIKIVKY